MHAGQYGAYFLIADTSYTLLVVRLHFSLPHFQVKQANIKFKFLSRKNWKSIACKCGVVMVIVLSQYLATFLARKNPPKIVCCSLTSSKDWIGELEAKGYQTRQYFFEYKWPQEIVCDRSDTSRESDGYYSHVYEESSIRLEVMRFPLTTSGLGLLVSLPPRNNQRNFPPQFVVS